MVRSTVVDRGDRLDVDRMIDDVSVDDFDALVLPGVGAGRRLMSWPSLRTDIINAGGDCVTEPLARCDCEPSILRSSRKPDDLPGLLRCVGSGACSAGGATVIGEPMPVPVQEISHRARLWVNSVSALLTVAGAVLALVVVFRR